MHSCGRSGAQALRMRARGFVGWDKSRCTWAVPPRRTWLINRIAKLVLSVSTASHETVCELVPDCQIESSVGDVTLMA